MKKAPSTYARNILIFAPLLLLGLSWLYAGTEEYFSSTKFCVACHSMTYPERELRASSHFGPLGFTPECGDCHLPPGFFERATTHAIDGAKDMVSNFRYNIRSEEDFDRYRAEFAHKARVRLKKWDSSPCRTCHRNPVPRNDWARPFHEEMRGGKKTCIDCHQNIFHKKVPEEDLERGIAEGRIVER